MDQSTTELLGEYGHGFSYDVDEAAFNVGQQTLPLSELADSDQAYILPATDRPPVGEAGLDSQSVLLVNFHIVMLPRLYGWLEQNLNKTTAEQTSQVMRDVFTTLRPDTVLPSTDSGLFSFSVKRLRAEHPHITLSTLGNCACLGVTPDGIFGQRYWPQQIANFTFHNIDTPVEAVSLYAGLGHLAHRANTETRTAKGDTYDG